MQLFLPNIDFAYFLKCNYNPEDLPTELPLFYRQILYAWFLLKKPPVNGIDVRRESVWYNQFITVGEKYVYYSSLAENDVLFIEDMVTNSGNFKTYEEFCHQYGIHLSHFQYMSLIDAIPITWRRLLKQQSVNVNICNTEEEPYCKLGNKDVNVKMLKSKDIYWNLMAKDVIEPTCVKAWSERLNLCEDTKYWKSVYTLPLLCIKDIRVREFQHKILHRYYPCQSTVSKWDPDTSQLCTLCHNDVANITHTFYNCVHVKSFWKEVEKHVNQMPHFEIEITCTQALMGFVPYTEKNKCLNHCVMYAKYFIHRERRKQTKPLYTVFRNYYLHMLIIEKENCVMKGRSQFFKDTFKYLLDAI